MWLLPSLILHVFPALIFVMAARKSRVLMNFYLHFIKENQLIRNQEDTNQIGYDM